MSKAVFTIGHSTHTTEHFIGLLKKHAITAVADVRSNPYSRMSSQFNREALSGVLRSHQIDYVYLGKELGARPADRSAYADGKVRYELLSRTDLFQSGITRVLDGADRHRLALMCAERDPLECHRSVLIARLLMSKSTAIHHILPDGGIESHEALVERMLQKLNKGSGDMFSSNEQLVADAYRTCEQAIAFEDQAAADDGSGR